MPFEIWAHFPLVLLFGVLFSMFVWATHPHLSLKYVPLVLLWSNKYIKEAEAIGLSITLERHYSEL